MLTQEQRQDIFNRVVEGLASQGFTRSMADGDACGYRGADGKKCAAGHLIPDDKYVPEMEFKLVNESHLQAIGIDPEDPARWLVSALQAAHDRAYTTTYDSDSYTRRVEDAPEQMKANLREVATRYGLELHAAIREENK